MANEITPAARQHARETIHSWAELQAQLDDYSLRARLEHRKWEHISAFDEEGQRIAGHWTKSVFKAEFGRYRTMMEQYNAAIAVMHEFGEAIDRAAILSGEGTLYEMLRGAYGAQDDGSVLLQLPAVGAFLVRPDDALTLPPWMRPDAPSDDDEG